MRYEDQSLRQVAEFHEAFGIVHPTAPFIPKLNDADRELVCYVATELAMIALRLKRQAAEANELGRSALGQILVRLQLHVEETGELAAGLANNDLVEVLDGLSDIGYVLNGSYLTFGLDELKSAADREVHRSNMSKLGAGGKPLIHPSGRVLKGPNYTPPELKALLERYMEDAA